MTNPDAMPNTPQPERLIAAALYEIRLLLAPYLGSESAAELPIRIAAHLAYALHNEAQAICEGETISGAAAITRIAAIDRVVGTEIDLVNRLTELACKDQR